jgi:asparagine synthase (glutamine-hydrolysing)
MCGIAGVFGEGGTVTVSRMLDTLIHRGPDDEHLVGDENFVLGARRLSIVDVQGGRQPMSNERGTVWVALNGELYNYPDQRSRLLEQGHRLLTSCDTELLPHLYEEHGPDFVRRLEGMFAIALWDCERGLGVLARDRAGEKPIYYTEHEGGLWYASEIKALLSLPGFQRRIHFESLHHYLALKQVPCPLTIYEGIYCLPPGHMLVAVAGQKRELRRYWAPDFSDDSAGGNYDEEEAIDHFLDLFKRSVSGRLMGDVPVGFFLSGGIDSSLTTAVAAEMSRSRVKTFTLIYGDQATTAGKDEDRRWARWVADRYQTDHHEQEVSFDDLPTMLPRILRSFDEPFAAAISSYFLSQLTRKHVKVAVSGDGADELFGSYLSHRLAYPIHDHPEYLRTGDSRLLGAFRNQPEQVARFAGQEDWRWRSQLMTFDEQERFGLYSADVAERLVGVRTDTLWRDTYRGLTASDPLNRVLESEYLTVFPDQLLTLADRLSMAHSLEVRTAFLDTPLVEYVARLSGRFKIRDGITKYLLKRAALRYFPSEMVHRRKEGFLMPITQWLLQNLQDYVRDTLSPSRLARHGIFRVDAVQALVDRMYAEDSDYTQVNKVYALVVFEEWYDLYMGPSTGQGSEFSRAA